MLALKRILPAAILLCLSIKTFSQCTVVSGPAPAKQIFNTGSNGISGTLGGGAQDQHWTVTMDSITGVYSPAIIMSNVPDVYYQGAGGSKWISISQLGSHSGDRFIFFKVNFDLPCNDPCGRPFSGNNAFTVNLDLYADNSVYEIYENGKPQSGNLGGIIPIQGPYQGGGSAASGVIRVSLFKDWKPGANTLIIQVASSAPITGLLAETSVNQPPPLSDTVTKSICEGGIYNFGTQKLTQAGIYRQTFHPGPGCDSNVMLILNVVPNKVTIDTSICQGTNYAGYTKTGIYTDKFTSSLGCDSTRTLNLKVYSKPNPHIEEDSILCTGDSLVISPGTFTSYLWQDGSTLDHYVVKKPGLYTVTITSSCGTVKSAVYINEVTCSYLVFPTAFTPNKDGQNDYFKVLTHFPLQQFKLTVYNRFGQKVFEESDPAKGWDGSFNNKSQPLGTYVWFCTYKKNGSTITAKGTVLLVR